MMTETGRDGEPRATFKQHSAPVAALAPLAVCGHLRPGPGGSARAADGAVR